MCCFISLYNIICSSFIKYNITYRKQIIGILNMQLYSTIIHKYRILFNSKKYITFLNEYQQCK